MAIDIKSCIILSILIHSLIALPFISNKVVNDPVKEEELQIDYVILRERPRVSDLPEVDSKPVETPRVGLNKKVDMENQKKSPQAEEKVVKTDPAEAIAKKEQRMRSTEDYINYYQLIREKIRRNVRRKYRNSLGEGEVKLSFVLKSNGKLISCSANSPSIENNPKLAKIVLLSIKAASPFGPFPKELDAPQMSFNIEILFKEE